MVANLREKKGRQIMVAMRDSGYNCCGTLSKYYSLHAQDTKYIYIWNHQFSP